MGLVALEEIGERIDGAGGEAAQEVLVDGVAVVERPGLVVHDAAALAAHDATDSTGSSLREIRNCKGEDETGEELTRTRCAEGVVWGASMLLSKSR